MKSLKKDVFGITSLRENGILKTDTKEKADICNRQFQSAFTREADSDPPSKGASPFSSMGEITVDLKGVAKLLDGLNVHKAHGPDGLNARVLKECRTQISPILALIYNESLAQGNVPDDWRHAMYPRPLRKEKIRCCELQTGVANLHLLQNRRAYIGEQHQQALSLR